MSYYNIGDYRVSHDANSINICFADVDADDSTDKKFRILLFLAWGGILLIVTVIPILLREFAHAVLLFCVIGGGGFYICVNIIKRAEMKYYRLIINSEGIYEIWNYPHEQISKSVSWNQLRYFRHFERVVARAGTPSLPYDCLVFSNQCLDDQNTMRLIRRTWRKSMQYELIFRKQEAIYLIVETQNGEELCKLIQDYIFAHIDKETLL